MTAATTQALQRCCFPHCTLDAEHLGDHEHRRPEAPGTGVRALQSFHLPHVWKIRCDVNSRHSLAMGLYVDRLGFGWCLCDACASRLELAP